MFEYFASIFTRDSINEFIIRTFDFKAFNKEFSNIPSDTFSVKFKSEFANKQNIGVNYYTFM